jgi:hypothetical protein
MMLQAKILFIIFQISAFNEKSGDSLIMSYFDNINNGSLNKYKKILKMEKNL